MNNSINFEQLKHCFPSLKRLALLIALGQIERIAGSMATEELIGKTIERNELQIALLNALKQTESEFRDICTDNELRDGLLDLHIYDVESFINSLKDYLDKPATKEFQEVLEKQLKLDFPCLTDEQITCSTELFLEILQRNLSQISSEFASKLTAVKILEIDKAIRQTTPRQDKISNSLMPTLPEMVIGRENDLEEIKKKLYLGKKLNKEIRRIITIRGWPGVGKTTLIATLAYDNEIAESFPDGILWASLGISPDIRKELAGWLSVLEEHTQVDQMELGQIQSRLAAILKNKRMLLLVDDVWKIEHAKPFLLGGMKSAIIFTTREKDISDSLSPSPELRYVLPVLTPDSSLSLLSKIAPEIVEKYPVDSKTLITELEGLPLAILVAGKLLSAEESAGLSVHQLILDLRELTILLERQAPANLGDWVKETTPTVISLLKKSTDLLDPETRNRYALLGLMAPKPATVDKSTLGLYWKVDDPSPTIRVLVSRGLLEYVPIIDQYQIHALMVAQAKSLLEVPNYYA